MKRALPAALLIGSACAPVPARGTPSPPTPDPEAFVRAVDSLRREAGIPGLSLAVVRDGRVVLARGLGLADPARGVPATPETPYNAASVAKPISAVVALRLAERGLLDLDAPMTGYRDWTGF